MITLNNTLITPTIFPDKTSQVWKIPSEALKSDVNLIEWVFESEAEFIHVAQLVHLIKNISGALLTLSIPYFPYARQDKEISNQSTFALRTFCCLLKTLGVHNIITQDIHSDVAKEYLPNLVSKFPQETVNVVLKKVLPRVIVFPDKGARTRYKDKFPFPSVTILKERDQSTGHLKIVGIEGNVDLLKGAKVLMIDDLCDGGMTFILAAQYLKTLDINEVSLYTTHGVYSKGVQVLKDAGIKRVFNRNGEV